MPTRTPAKTHGKTKKKVKPTAKPRIETISDEEIRRHPMLSGLEKNLVKVFRDQAKEARESFSMRQYAEIAFRACARNCGDAVCEDRLDEAAVLKRLKHAAALYFREMLADAGANPEILMPFEAVGKIFL